MTTLGEELRMMGHKVSYIEIPEDYSPDIIHHFNIGRPEMAIELVRKFPKVPLVIQSIYVDYSKTDGLSNSLMRKLFSAILGEGRSEIMKELFRWVKGQRKFPNYRYLWRGHKQSIQFLLNRSSNIVAASFAEKSSLVEKYVVDETKLMILPPPIAKYFFQEAKESKANSGVLCAARIEPLKNQLNLIRAWNPQRHGPLLILGKSAPNHKDYLQKCLEEGMKKAVEFREGISHAKMMEVFDRYKVHALPSLYETTGLSSLESLARGNQVVVSDSPIQRELFQNRATFVNPQSVESIAAGLDKAMGSEESHREWVQSNFHPSVICKTYEDIYKEATLV